VPLSSQAKLAIILLRVKSTTGFCQSQTATLACSHTVSTDNFRDKFGDDDGISCKKVSDGISSQFNETQFILWTTDAYGTLTLRKIIDSEFHRELERI